MSLLPGVAAPLPHRTLFAAVPLVVEGAKDLYRIFVLNILLIVRIGQADPNIVAGSRRARGFLRGRQGSGLASGGSRLRRGSRWGWRGRLLCRRRRNGLVVVG
jgi:hypothetical protein